MNEKDMKIRKEWLLLLAITPVWSLVFSLIYFATLPVPEGIPTMVHYGTQIFVILAPFGANYLIYRCAYRKPGTKFLTFLIYATPISLVLSALAYIFFKPPVPNNTLYWIQTIGGTGMALWFYVLNFKMRAINRVLKTAN